MKFVTLSRADLARASGGAAPNSAGVIIPTQCTPDNPTGARQYTHSVSNDRSGPSMAQRYNQAFDRAMAPWTTFNGLFGGASGRAPRPNPPSPQRPTYQ